MSLDSHFLGGLHWSGLFEELQSVQSCQTSGNAANLKARGKVKCFSNVPDALETSCILGQSIFSNVFYQLIVP